MRKVFQRLSLDKKSLLVIISCVMLSFAVLSALIIRRETSLLEADSGKTAEILATSIATALKDNMLGGRPEETLRLMKELSVVEGVKELAILKPEGGVAFQLPGASMVPDSSAREKLLAGQKVLFSAGNARYFLTPLMNEQSCHSCHSDNKPLRGVIVVALSTAEISRNVLGLTKRMAGFGATVAAVLSALLIFFNRRIILSPIKGLTEAAKALGRGDLDQRVSIGSKDEIGQLGETFNAMIEIRKRTEEELRESEARYRNLFESAHDMVQSVSPEGRFIFVNTSWLKTMGYTFDELQKITMFDILHPSCTEHCMEIFKKVMSGETVDNIEATFMTKDGRLVDVEGNVTVRFAGGKVIASQGIFRNITERKRAEEGILQAKQDWESTFNSITDMITVHDKGFNIVRSNKAAETILGLPFLEVTREKCYQYLHGTRCTPEDCPGCECLKTGKPTTFERFEPHLNKFVEISAIPRFDSNNQLIGLIHVVRDITERKRADERIQRQMQRLSALRSIDMAISSNLDLRVTLSVFIEQVMSQLRVDAADVFLLNPHTKMLEYATSSGFRSNSLKHSHLRLGEGYAGVVAREKRISRVLNIKEEENFFTQTGLSKGEDFVTYYGVPLVAKEQVKGVLEIFHRSTLDPDEEWFEFLDSLALQAAIALDNNSLFYDLERSNMDLTLAYDSTIEGWSRALDYRDKETEGHSRRVTEMTLRMVREMGMNEDELVHIRRGALLHDIGKMGIPDSILLKPAPLTEEEWKVMRRHPVYAYELLYPIVYLRPALDIPYCHHEHWDGTGYPRGLKGEQIPLPARIFAVVDVWDGLRSNRPYRTAWSDEKAKEHLRAHSGTQFDPDVVDVFFKMQS